MDTYIITSVIKCSAGVAIKAEAVADDGQSVREFLISDECLRSFPFNEGDEITSEDADMLEEEAQFCRAYASALRIFSRSAQSRFALIRKLCRQGFSKEIAERAADHAEAMGVLDEKKEASSRAEYYIRHKYWGKKRIAAELMSKGYTKSAVFSAIGNIDDEVFSNNLARLIEKKPVPEEKSARDKYIAALCRMGYSLPEILRAVKTSE